jgi:beta-lactam-binding protein with PASTA domain
MDKGNIKNAPPLLGRYRLLKEKSGISAYRSFLAFDLKLKRGVVVKLISVERFQKKHLPILWKYVEKAFRKEENISRIVEIDFQKDSLLVAEEYLEGRYFNSRIFENPHEYDRFESILYRSVDLVKKIHSNGIPHGFLDFRNLKLTQNDGVIIEDYPILHWLEMNNLLPGDVVPNREFKAEIRDMRQLGLILFNLYRTQLVPEFHSFPRKYSRKDIYDFFRSNSFAYFSDVERVVAKLLLGSEQPKGYISINEAFREVKDNIGVLPPVVYVRGKIKQVDKIDATQAVKQTKSISTSEKKTQDFAQQLGKPVETPYSDEQTAAETPTHEDAAYPQKPEIYSRRELVREKLMFRGVAWLALFISIITIALTLLVITKGFIATSIPEIVTPDFVGMSFNEAESRAKKNGLKLQISSEEYHDELPEGLVIEHQPQAGARTKRGRTVYTILSKGVAVVNVPNLISHQEDEATSVLSSVQLNVGRKEYEFNEDVALGIVVDQSPPPNVKVAVGEMVNLTISAGLLKSTIPMPNLEGMSLNEALTFLDRKRLRVRRIIRSYSDYYERDGVQYQSPAAGAEVEFGMMVDLEVVMPKQLMPMEGFQVALTVVLPDYDGRKRVKIIDKNQKTEKTIYNELHKGREMISLLAEGYGRTNLKVYLDNELIREEVF